MFDGLLVDCFGFVTNGREGKFELDSLMNFLRLSHTYFTIVVNSSDPSTYVQSPFDRTWLQAVNKTLEVVANMSRSLDEQHLEPSYKFQRSTYVPSDTLLQFGLGPPSKACGLVRSPFRASDDATNLPLNIPENALAVVALRGIAEMCSYGSKIVITCDDVGDIAASFASVIDAAIYAHGISTNSRFPGVLAYEVDCFGNQVCLHCTCACIHAYRTVQLHLLSACFTVLMSCCPPFQLFFDDANSPSLLSLPYIGWIDNQNPLYRATRNLILGDSNPFFFRGSAGEGIGSPHVPWRFVWPMSITMRALTSSSDDEIIQCLMTLRDTTAGNSGSYVIGLELLKSI